MNVIHPTEEILRRLRAGEDGRNEFKRVDIEDGRITGPSGHNLAAGFVAFTNAEGGMFFLGVDDAGTPIGIPPDRLDHVEQWVVNIASDLCDPPIRPILHRVMVPADEGEATILLAEIKRGLYVHRTARGRYFLRVGSTRRDLDPTELARLFQDRGREFVFDERLVYGASATDLSQTRLEAHFGIGPAIPWPDLLRNTRVTIRGSDGVDRPSVAGLLAFGPEPTEHMMSAYVEAACYGGTRMSSDDLVRGERLTSSVADQIDAGIAFVMHYMRHRGPDAEPAYDVDVIDEAIVNAVAHRDYSVSGSKIRLLLFADRLELYSPGKLPNGITIEDMPYRIFTRNQLLVGFLSRMRSKRTGDFFLESRRAGGTVCPPPTPRALPARRQAPVAGRVPLPATGAYVARSEGSRGLSNPIGIHLSFALGLSKEVGRPHCSTCLQENPRTPQEARGLT